MTEPQPHSPRRTGGLGRAVEAGLSGEAATARGVLEAIGGWRGLVESLLPATVYLVVFVLTRDARISAIAPLVLSVGFLVWRLARREPLASALAGAFGVLVCVLAVMFTGDGSSYFVPGFFINAAWILGYGVSMLIGWPLIGLLLGFLRGSLTEWRKVPALRHAAMLTSGLWLVVFASRLAVQLPLFFAGNTEALGLARLVMGVPLFVLAVLFTWFVLSRVTASVNQAHAEPDESENEDNSAAPGDSSSSSDE